MLNKFPNLIFSKIITFLHANTAIYSQHKQEYTFLGALFVAVIVTLILAMVLAIIISIAVVRVDTEIRTEFTVKEFTFVANRDVKLNSLKFQSLTINNFSNITLYPLPAEPNDSRFKTTDDVSKMVIVPEQGSKRFASVYVQNINDEHCKQQMPTTINFPRGNEEQLYEYFLSVMSFMGKL